MMRSSDDREMLEDRVRRIGQELVHHIPTSGPLLFSPRWWDDFILRWASADDRTKVDLFRFVDVMPTLTTDESIAEHLRVYFPSEETRLPWPLKLASRLSKPGTWTGNLVARLTRWNVRRMARQFVAGTNPDEIARHVAREWKSGTAFTIDMLGEATITPREAESYERAYLELLGRLSAESQSWPMQERLERTSLGDLPRVNLSVKASALTHHFEPLDRDGVLQTAGTRLRNIFKAAREKGAFINLDMEHHAYKDLTIDLFCTVLSEPAFRDWPNVGIAIQAYLKESERDLCRLCDWVRQRGTPIHVRLVKGAYWDYETVTARHRGWPAPVYHEKWQSDASFECSTTFLLENCSHLRPAFASHNVRSIAHALAVADHLDVPREDLEIQMLHGMADPFKSALDALGVRLRIYTPYGQLLPGMAYLVRRLLENSSNESFVHHAFRQHRKMETLLAPPAPSRERKEIADMIAAERKPREAEPLISNEPLLDFSLSTNREAMARGIELARSRIGRHFPLYLQGKEVDRPERITAINPARTSEVLGTVAKGTRSDVDAAVAESSKAERAWGRMPIGVRLRAVRALADAMRRRRTELAGWEVLECGKQWREADADVAEAIDFCEYYAEVMADLAKPRLRRDPGEENSYRYHSRGTSVVIAPWNFPLAILCGMTVAPLVAGNPVIVKPAEQSSMVGGLFAELVRESCDLPTGVFQFLPGDGEIVGARLVEHPDVAVINFTGSRAVGLEILRVAHSTGRGRRHVKQVLAEMGGKNAVIVDDDADLDEAVAGVVRSAFGYQGQKCSACSRVITLPRVHGLFVDRLIEATAGLEIGPPEDPRYAVGPVIDKDAFDRLTRVIESASREASLLHAGEVGALSQQGYFIPPHIFGEVEPQHFLAQQEFFGPILTVLRARDIEDALSIANGTEYALTGGVYSRNPGTIERVREEMVVGNLYINRPITGAEVDRQPFGGTRLSGTGSKAGGRDYLLHFVTGQTTTENTLRRGFAPETS